MEQVNSQAFSRMRDAICNFVTSRGDTFPISMADMIRRVRYAMPEVSASDEELNQLIAQAVVDAGGNVAFDTRSEQTRLVPR